MTTAGSATTQLVDKNLFRDVMGRFASGVTVITTRAQGADSRDDGERGVLAVDGAADGARLPQPDERPRRPPSARRAASP